jgi:hypothetical protein
MKVEFTTSGSGGTGETLPILAPILQMQPTLVGFHSEPGTSVPRRSLFQLCAISGKSRLRGGMQDAQGHGPQAD